MDLDLTYTFNVEDVTRPEYLCAKPIIYWLKENMESLKDKNNDTVFSRVNYGYNNETIKGFGKKPVCDVYINTMDYRTDFDDNTPATVTSFIICYLKGNMNNAYEKACELTDYLIQAFEDNTDFRELSIRTVDGNETIIHNIVRDTRIANIELQIIPTSKTYGVLVAFELEHELIK